MKLNYSTHSSSNPLNESERAAAEKPTHALLQVTDVGDFPTEFDAWTTIMSRHLRPLQDTVFSIGRSNPNVLKYAADFLTSLPAIIRDRIGRAEAQAGAYRRAIPEDVSGAMKSWDEETLRILLNYAPRDQRKSEHKNGRDFHLAFVDGVEVYAVPAAMLQYLKARGKIDSLFRIPTENHPLTDSNEQFRSSLYAATAHEAPEHLQTVWRRGDLPEVLDHVIPDLTHDEVAFVDKPYHNRRIITPDLSKLEQKIHERQNIDGTILIRLGGSIVRAHIAKCLADVPEGKWGVWFNPAEVKEGNAAAGYYELSRRWEPGTHWSDRGQFPSHYLASRDREIGTEAEILPKGSNRQIRDYVRSKIAALRKAA